VTTFLQPVVSEMTNLYNNRYKFVKSDQEHTLYASASVHMWCSSSCNVARICPI